MEDECPDGYHIVELNQRVLGASPIFFRWKRRADRRCRKLNNTKRSNTYRYEVCDWLDGRWAVVAMQNQLQKQE